MGGKSPDEVPESVEEIEAHAPPPAPEPAVTDEDDIPMPASSAPPPPYSAPTQSPGNMPARSARFRRGSRGGRVAPASSDVPKIGVVEVDPNFRPRIEVVPSSPTRSPVAPLSPESPSGDSRRAEGVEVAVVVARVARPALTARSGASVAVVVGAAGVAGEERAAGAAPRVVAGATAIARRRWTSGPRGGLSRRLLSRLRRRPRLLPRHRLRAPGRRSLRPMGSRSGPR